MDNQIPKTIENTKITSETTVEKDDPEVLGDEADDEFAVYRNGTKVREEDMRRERGCVV